MICADCQTEHPPDSHPRQECVGALRAQRDAAMRIARMWNELYDQARKLHGVLLRLGVAGDRAALVALARIEGVKEP